MLRYCDEEGVSSAETNPNGSAHDIAGIVNARGNVLGMMPHPERSFEGLTGERGGSGIFQSLLGSFS